jgi:polyphosphate kinase 2 (PPK2 family)
MLENVNLQRTLSKEEYRQALPALQRRLYDLEKACWDNGTPSVIIFEGWDASGKGGCISTLTQRLDPRGFKLHATHQPRTHDLNFPWLRRFWLRTPNRGEMVILDHSWYHRVLDERVDKIVAAGEWRKAYTDIVEFERMLEAGGCVFVKFWFHISRDEQKKRFRAIERDPLEAWRISEQDWKRHQQYDEYLEAAEQMLEMTESGFAPWTIIEATSKYYARNKVFVVIINALEHALGDKAPPVRTEHHLPRAAAAVKAVAAPVEVKPEKKAKPKKLKKEKKAKPEKKVKPKKEKPEKRAKPQKAVKPEKKAKPEKAKPAAVKAKTVKPQAAEAKVSKPKTAAKKGGKSNA